MFFLKRIYYKVVYGGASRPGNFEIEILEAIANALNQDQQNIIRRQIKNIFLVQKEHENKMIRYTINKDLCESFFFRNPEEDLVLAEASYTLDGFKNKVQVTLYEGYLFSMESNTQITKRELRRKPEDIQVEIVLLPCSGKSIAEILDEDEHPDYE